MRTLSVIALSIVLLVLVNSAAKTYFFKKDLPRYSRVTEFALINQENQKFESKSLLGKITILQVFFASCPQVCPLVTSKVSSVAEELKGYENINFISITIDAERDSPEVLKKYAERFKANFEKWNFLTGDPQIIKNLIANNLYLDSGEEKNMHSTRLVLLDKDLVIRGYYSTDDESSLKRLVEDASSLN